MEKVLYIVLVLVGMWLVGRIAAALIEDFFKREQNNRTNHDYYNCNKNDEDRNYSASERALK